MPYPTIFRTPGVAAFAEAVDDERGRQLTKWGDQRHPDGTGGALDRQAANTARAACQHAAEKGVVTWRDILGEEIAEAFAETDPAKLREELLQSAAVIQAWLSDLDRRPVPRACHLVHDHDGHEPHTWTDVDGNWLNCPGSGTDAAGEG